MNCRNASTLWHIWFFGILQVFILSKVKTKISHHKKVNVIFCSFCKIAQEKSNSTNQYIAVILQVEYSSSDQASLYISFKKVNSMRWATQCIASPNATACISQCNALRLFGATF
jgi:fatty acid/phospholipid biosynthesis enzyme